jgi:RNA polymerase sigma-54 factor
MSLRQTITITQKPMLVMTPKLQQAIKILQMHRLELAQYISQQMVENPVLEESYDEVEETSEESETEDETGELEDEIAEADVDLETGLPDTDDVVSEADTPELDVTDDDFGDVDWEKYFDDSSTGSNEWETPLDDETHDNMVTLEESLEEHLLWQLRMSVTSEDDYAIGETIIGDIDNDGYLTTDVEEIAETLERDVAEVERVLKIVQTFEPTGVGARNLKECLLMQLRQLGLEDTIAYEIVEKDYLQDLEANRFPQIAKELRVELELVREAANAIASLEPKPGRQFSSMKPEYVIPDVTVEKIDGDYKVFMNDYGPRLRLSPYYQGMLSSRGSLPDEAREYIRSKIQSAKWLLESIERRRSTIQRVTESIFEVQKDFLDKGPSYLKPLTLREIADMVGVHEATVSRVTRNRYVQTPRGVFELKYFFNSGISTESGSMASSVSVKEMIKSMIDNEDPQNPLSDRDIELQLNQNGIKIARRTIAKYRGELNILPSSKRRQW